MRDGLDDIPEGYKPHFRKSPVTDPWEPLFSKVADGTVSLGMRVREAHCNARGFLHGGVLTALTDNAMGLSVIEMLRTKGVERAKAGVTLTLAVDFLAAANIRQWLEITPRVLKAGQTLAFVDCLVTADGRPVARANASFRVYSTAASN